MIAVLLDWSKAFDRGKHDAFLDALRRLGLPADMLDMVAAIYKCRRYALKGPAGSSSVRKHAAGIAQGCPLLPYVFIIVQSVMVFDIGKRMDGVHNDIREPEYLVRRCILYAGASMLFSA